MYYDYPTVEFEIKHVNIIANNTLGHLQLLHVSLVT